MVAGQRLASGVDGQVVGDDRDLTLDAGHLELPVHGCRDVGRDDVLSVAGLQRAAVEQGGRTAVGDAQIRAAGQLGGDRDHNEADKHPQHDQDDTDGSKNDGRTTNGHFSLLRLVRRTVPA